jgi:undecaprenyl-diphosphatase
MPSSHTSAAAALGIALAIMYPRLTWLMVGLVAIVAIARVTFGAHYPSDVVAGATVGLLVTWAVMQWLGERENRAALSENC